MHVRESWKLCNYLPEGIFASLLMPSGWFDVTNITDLCIHFVTLV